jgi:NAD+ synthase (glutamine-hydrolysing)
MFPDIEAEQIDLWIDRFVRLFLQSIYKWVQSPLSLHIGNLDLERERALQLPVVTNANWTKPRPPVA